MGQQSDYSTIANAPEPHVRTAAIEYLKGRVAASSAGGSGVGGEGGQGGGGGAGAGGSTAAPHPGEQEADGCGSTRPPQPPPRPDKVELMNTWMRELQTCASLSPCSEPVL